jgi:hypothetical protein
MMSSGDGLGCGPVVLGLALGALVLLGMFKGIEVAFWAVDHVRIEVRP